MLRATYKAKPDYIPKDRTIKYGDIFGLTDILEIRRQIIEQEAEAYNRLSTEEQIDRIVKFIKIVDLHKAIPCLGNVAEMLLRRHAIVHAGGVASPEYIRRISDVENLNTRSVKTGDMLSCSEEYLNDVWNQTTFVCVALTELSIKQIYKKEHNKIAEAESLLNQAGFDCLLRKEWQAALLIFKYTIDYPRVDDELNGMARINYAIALRHTSQDEEANKIVAAAKWKAASPLLRLGASAVRADFDAFERDLRVCHAEGDSVIGVDDLHRWPVFEWVRGDPRFSTLVESLYGKQTTTTSSKDVLFEMLSQFKNRRRSSSKTPKS
ncbi:MAG: hypothetical protein IT436_07030 [Phycisphaerales bacterium]|nr:hypothetical protein [Phycisphaerales bacterium]